MPRYPDARASLSSVGTSVFSALSRRLATFPGEVYPMHVGDTWLTPASGSRMQDLSIEQHPGLHRYSAPQGQPELISTLAQRLTERSGVATTPEQVLVSTGATGGLGAVLGALTDPGDEVIILAPFWPLIDGIVRSFGAQPVHLPFFQQSFVPENIAARLDQALTPRTVALYFNSPNNPTGETLSRAMMTAIAHWARQHDLWLLADEVYEDLQFHGEHVSCRQIAPHRTFAVHSFSKAYGMAGNRCGYVVGPGATMPELRKIALHSFYSAPTASQVASLAVLSQAGDRWLAQARARYLEVASEVADALAVEPPAGGTFLFLDVADQLDDRGLLGLLEDAADQGVFVAPGPSFGPYPHHIRLCFTATTPEVTLRGVAILKQILGR